MHGTKGCWGAGSTNQSRRFDLHLVGFDGGGVAVGAVDLQTDVMTAPLESTGGGGGLVGELTGARAMMFSNWRRSWATSAPARSDGFKVSSRG